MNSDRVFAGVCNDKGGVGKSLTTALLVEQLSQESRAWDLIEVEARTTFTQSSYQLAPATTYDSIALLAHNKVTGLPEPSLSSLEKLWNLIPEPAEASSRIMVDFGAAAFQYFLMWSVQHRGLQKFRAAGYRFVFFVVVQAADAEGAVFFNMNAATLLKLGEVVLVKNLRQGDNFSHIDPAIVALVKTIVLPWGGNEVAEQLQEGEGRLTFGQLAQSESASRRAILSAEECATDFAAQFARLRKGLLL